MFGARGGAKVRDARALNRSRNEQFLRPLVSLPNVDNIRVDSALFRCFFIRILSLRLLIICYSH